MHLIPMTARSVAIITGTVGSMTLADTITSVNAQTVPVEHWVVVDGQHHEHGVRRLIEKAPAPPPHITRVVMVLPENTGGSGYLCHRINAAVPWLVDTDYVCFLDDDNMIAPNHVQKLLEALEATPNATWAYAHRTIIDTGGEVVCKDNCESLGSMTHTVLGPDDRHIDTNCYMVSTELGRHISPLWNVKARQPGQMEADRQVCRILLRHEPIHAISPEYSVMYRVARRPDSVSKDFFLHGNALLGRAVGGYDASRPTVYVFDTDPATTAALCHGTVNEGRDHPWQFDQTRGGVNLCDGFANTPFLPHGATCVFLHGAHSHAQAPTRPDLCTRIIE